MYRNDEDALRDGDEQAYSWHVKRPPVHPKGDPMPVIQSCLACGFIYIGDHGCPRCKNPRTKVL